MCGQYVKDSKFSLREETKMANKMTIEFRNGKKIVKHPSGVTSEYATEALEKHREHLIERKQNIDEEIALIDQDLASAKASKIS